MRRNNAIQAVIRRARAQGRAEAVAIISRLCPETGVSRIARITPRWEGVMLADEYAANFVGFKTFTDYALSRVGKLPLQEFLGARAKYKIVEYLHSNGDNQKNDLVNLTFQGANPMGPKALSELRCARVVVRKSAGKRSLVLAAGVTLSRFVSAISPQGIVAPVSFDWE